MQLNVCFHSKLLNIFVSSECPPPPAGNYSSVRTVESYVDGEYWTFTKVNYTCAAYHTFLPGQVETRVCGAENEDGVWDDYRAPICKPGLF